MVCIDFVRIQFILKALDYIVLGGKQFRFGQLITAYKELTSESERTPEMMHKIYMLGWVCELVKTCQKIFRPPPPKKKESFFKYVLYILYDKYRVFQYRSSMMISSIVLHNAVVDRVGIVCPKSEYSV